MAVTCDLDIESLSTESFSSLDYVVMGHVFKCHDQLGRLADERIYEASLAARLSEIQWESRRQVPIVVSHGTFSKTFVLDLVVGRKGVYELKTVAKLTEEHVAQLLTYLYLLDLPRGKLVNFRSFKVESRFVNAPLSRSERTSFSIASSHYLGSDQLIETAVDMLLDWGTSLSVSLYRDFFVHVFGGETVAKALLPLADGQHCLGHQRFLLVSPKESLQVTCFSRIPPDYRDQLQSLLGYSSLDATQWINIDVNTVTFKTITRK